jgi:hypothetical protein
MPDLEKGNVEELCRRVRIIYYPAHVSSTQALHEQLKSIKLSDFKDVELYLKSLKLIFQRLADQGETIPEGLRISFLIGGLPRPEYNTFILFTSSARTIADYQARLMEYARNEPNIPGSLHPQAKRGPQHPAHSARDKFKDTGKKGDKGKDNGSTKSQEDCRNFAAGRCRNGDKCPYRHAQLPTQLLSSAPSPKTKQARHCTHCSKDGHSEDTCFQKFPELAAKFRQDRAREKGHTAVQSGALPDPAHATQSGAPVSFRMFPYSDSAFAAYSDCAFAADSAIVTEVPLEFNFTADSAYATTSVPRGVIPVCWDSGCTSTIFTSTTGLINLRSPPGPIEITVGGGHGVSCSTIGDFDGHVLINGRLSPLSIQAVRVVPTFGINLHPLSLYKEVLFKDDVATATEGSTPVFQATKQANGLFWASLFPSSTSVTPVPDRAHYTHDEDISLHCIVVSDDVEHCYRCLTYDTAFVSRAYSEGLSELRLWHERLGHLNLAALCRLLGVPLPPKPFFCKGCVAGKSTRQSFKHLEWAPHFTAPRAAHTFHSDVAGPFTTTTDGFNSTIFFVCGHARFIFIKLVTTTSEYTLTWINLVNRQEAQAGSSRVVAVLHSDGATYMDTLAIREFNASRGIVHHTSPAYTPELNGIAEITIRVVFEMARTMCIHGGAPSHLGGDAQHYAVAILNHLPKSGDSKTRKELFTGKTEPDPLKKFRTLFCSVWVQDVHPGIKPASSKFAPRSIEYLYCGLSEDGYIVRSLADFKLRKQTVLHCVFDETSFPCRTRFNQGVDFSDPFPTGTVRLSGREVTLLPMPVPEATSLPVPVPALVSIDYSLQCGLLSSHREIALAADVTGAYSSFDAPPSMWAALNLGPTETTKLWYTALLDELSCHVKFKTLSPPLRKEDIPPGVRPIPLDGVLKIKREGRKKVRVIIKGFHLIDGRDYNETFAGVPDLTVIKLILSIVGVKDWELKGSDALTAFLQADIDSKILVQVPDWFLNPRPDFRRDVYTYHYLLKAIPGIPQAPRLFNRLVTSVVVAKAGLVQCPHCPSLFVCLRRKLIFFHWVDDFYMAYPTSSSAEALACWAVIRSQIDTDEPSDVIDMLGCEIVRDRPHRTLTILQTKAIRVLQSRVGFSDVRTADTPMDPRFIPTKADCPSQLNDDLRAQQSEYRSHLMSLVYFSRWTMPQISFAVSKLGKFMANPGPVHFTALKRLLRFVFGNAEVGLKFPAHATSKTNVYGYNDTSFADDVDTRRSTAGFAFFYAGCALTWHSRLLSSVTLSTNHTEYAGSSIASREGKFLHSVFTFLGMAREVSPIDLFGDNTGAVSLARNPIAHAKNKHIELADHYVRELVSAGVISTSHIPTVDMVADIFTKPLDVIKFSAHAATLTGQPPKSAKRKPVIGRRGPD